MNQDNVIANEVVRLKQEARLIRLEHEALRDEYLVVSFAESDGSSSLGISTVLVPNDLVKQSLQEWTSDDSDGHPGTSEYWKDGVKVVEYLRYGNDDGFEPLIIHREFHGICPDYCEISEEFRLFHRLYHDRPKNQFIKFDDYGNSEVVATIEEQRIRIKRLQIRQFLAIKNMHLAWQFDSILHSPVPLDQLGLTRQDWREWKTESKHVALHFGESIGSSRNPTISRLVGKYIIEPLTKEKSDFFSFAPEKAREYVEFILGVNDDGEQVSYTCDPNKLSNEYDESGKYPDFFTPVYFRKQVLEKYYRESSKYQVESGSLRCASLWSLPIDNYHDGHVAVWLGDLARLQYEEQSYWRSHNISSGSVSSTYFRQQRLNQWTTSDQIDHIFQTKYRSLAESSQSVLGWKILRPLPPADLHHLSCIRIPLTEEMSEFDELVLGLTKLLVDSLNEAELKKILVGQVIPERGIPRLEAVCNLWNVPNSDSQVSFLRSLQSLRSRSAAHRKGSDYQESLRRFSNEGSLQKVFSTVLTQSIDYLSFLENDFIPAKPSSNVP